MTLERPGGTEVLYHILFNVPTNEEVVAVFTSIFQIRKVIIWEVVICPRSQSLSDRTRIWIQAVWPHSACYSEPISLPWLILSYRGLPIHLLEPLPRSMALLHGHDLGAAQGSHHHCSLTSLVRTSYTGFVLPSLSLHQSNVFLPELTGKPLCANVSFLVIKCFNPG